MHLLACRIGIGLFCCFFILIQNQTLHAQGALQRLKQRLQENANGPNGAGFNPLDGLVPLMEAPELLEEESIDQLVRPLSDALAKHPAGTAPLRIAVFAFGNQEGEIPEGLVGPALDTQGAITAALRKQLLVKFPGKFVLLDKFELQRMFKKHAKDPASVSPSNPMLVDVLKQVEIDAAVVGTLEGVGFSASVIFAGLPKNPMPISASLTTADYEPNFYWGLQTRIGVSLQCRKDRNSSWEAIPLVQDMRMFGSRIYAAIDPRQENYEYQVLVANRRAEIGKIEGYLGNIANPDAREERNRLFGVAVLIDGVNSFYEDKGNGERGPIALTARDAKKWLIGPAGWLIKAKSDGSPFLAPANGPDHSTVAVKGFQDGNKFAHAFQLAKVDAKGANQVVVAEALGISQSIGLISVFVFSEKLKGDKGIGAAAAPGKPSLGTAAGRQIMSPVTNLKVDFHRQPVEQIHIHYRLNKEIPFPQAQWRVLN